ncbi:MAG: hypothetical protein WBX18_01915 [Terracidiphilus sp.]
MKRRGFSRADHAAIIESVFILCVKFLLFLTTVFTLNVIRKNNIAIHSRQMP